MNSLVDTMQAHRFLAAYLFTLVFAIQVHPSSSSTNWELQTPGGHTIGITDPYQKQHGCVLRTNDVIHASHITNWSYHIGYITGTCKKGQFIFNEATAEISFYIDGAASNIAIDKKSIGSPTSILFKPKHIGYLMMLWPHEMGKQVDNWIVTWLSSLDHDQRNQLALDMQTDLRHLHKNLVIKVIKDYQPAFYADHNTHLIIAGQDDLQATTQNILDSANQIRSAPEPIPPFIQFLLEQYAHPEIVNYKPPANSHPLQTTAVIHFCNRILNEYLQPSPPSSNSPDTLLPRHLREQPAKIARDLIVQIQIIRTQLDLARLQHKDSFPDLCKHGWRLLTQSTGPGPNYPPGDKYGPYIKVPPINRWSPDSNPSSIAPDTSAAWKYDRTTGEITPVIALSPEEFKKLKLQPNDAIRVDPDPQLTSHPIQLDPSPTQH